MHILTHVHLPPHSCDHFHSLLLFPPKHPDTFDSNGHNVLLDIYCHEMRRRLERKDAVDPNHKPFLQCYWLQISSYQLLKRARCLFSSVKQRDGPNDLLRFLLILIHVHLWDPVKGFLLLSPLGPNTWCSWIKLSVMSKLSLAVGLHGLNWRLPPTI